MDRRNALAILPVQRVGRTTRGGVVLPSAFVDVMRKYAESWRGPITALMEPSDRSKAGVGEEAIDPADLPFRIAIASHSDPQIAHHLAGHALALGFLSHRQNHLARLCRRVGTPMVYVAENALSTRLQLAWSSASNAAVAIRRHSWELGQERQHREAIARAAGVQCNGLPTYRAYRGLSPNAFLFFDAPTAPGTPIREDELEARLVELSRGGPLRLLGSDPGRLNAMEGGGRLIRVATELKRLGTAFEMTICGRGGQEPQMRADVARLGLGDLVTFARSPGPKADPTTEREADLFVCCQRSGDPSGSYLEALARGTPIVGYGNESFEGIAQESGAGWATMDRPARLASKIAELSADRRALADASRRALAFARLWTFEETFRARIEHLKSCAAPSLAGQGWGGRLAIAVRPQASLEDRRIGSI
jgi:hypothetical protein